MGLMTRPVLPEAGEEQRWHAYVRCDAEIEEHLAGTRARRFLRSRVADAFERTLNDRDRAVIADYLGLVLESQNA